MEYDVVYCLHREDLTVIYGRVPEEFYVGDMFFLYVNGNLISMN